MELKKDNIKFAQDLKESNLQFKQDMTQQFLEQQKAYIQLQNEVKNITTYIKNGTKIQPVSPDTSNVNRQQQTPIHQITQQTPTHQTTQPQMDTSNQQRDTSTQKHQLQHPTLQNAIPITDGQQDTNHTSDNITTDLAAFQDPAIFVDTEAEGTDQPLQTQEEEQQKYSDTATITTATTTSTTSNSTTTESSLQRMTRAQKRKVESDQMEISDGQSSIENSRAPQGSSPNEGKQF